MDSGPPASPFLAPEELRYQPTGKHAVWVLSVRYPGFGVVLEAGEVLGGVVGEPEGQGKRMWMEAPVPGGVGRLG